MSETRKRALGVIRLSELTDATSSPERQRETITRKARELGFGEAEITWAQDLDVSAFHVPPLKRPQLAAAFNRLEPGTTVLFFKLDRFVRRAFPDWADMLAWAGENDVRLVSATEALDLTGTMGQWQSANMAFVAQLESENISLRVRSAQAHFRTTGRWRGGTPAYGYRPARNPVGAGWVLVPDEETAPIVRDAVARVLAGESVNSIAAEFNQRGLLSPLDRARVLQAKPRLCACGHDEHDGECCEIHKCRHRVKDENDKRSKQHKLDECSQPCPGYTPRKWERESLMAILRSPALLGHVLHNDRPELREDNHMPVERAKPLIDPSDWEPLQQILNKASTVKARTQTPSALLGVAFCGCGKPLYRTEKTKPSGKAYAYYRCRENYRHPADDARYCNAPSIPCSVLDEITYEALLSTIGWYKVMKLEVTAGDGHEKELVKVGQQIASLTTDRFVRGIVADNYDEMMASLQAEHARLSALPRIDPEPRKVPTGQTFRQKWEQMDTSERRLWLRNCGVRVAATRNGDWPMAGYGERRAARGVGDMQTVSDIPRWIMEEDGDLRVFIELGSLKDLLARA